jgi:hypothetical protein
VIKAEIEHDIFIKFISNPECNQIINESTKFVRNLLNKDLIGLKKARAIKQVLYLNWILKMSEKNFFLYPYGKDAISLIDINLNSMIVIRYCFTITVETKNILKDLYKNAIEIVSLHSNKKGEGTRLIKEAIAFSKDINLPLVLYAETHDLVKYYEQFNFGNHGKLGDNNEFLMIRLPK